MSLDDPCLVLEMAERVWERDKRISALRDEVARLTRELRSERTGVRRVDVAETVAGLGATPDHLG